MNPGQLGKIRSLIQTSTILNPQERGEWLVLLELMDDKQLFELEKILSENYKYPANAIRPPHKATEDNEALGGRQILNLKPEPPPVQAPKPFEPQKATPTPQPSPISAAQQMGIPPLTHILNLPKEFAPQAPQNLPFKPVLGAEPKQAGITNLPNVRPPIRPAEQTKQSGFLTRLKDILKEKELPAPKMEIGDGKSPIAKSGEAVGGLGPLTSSQRPEIWPGKLASKSSPPPVPKPSKVQLPPQGATKPVIVPSPPILQKQIQQLNKAAFVVSPSSNRQPPSSATSVFSPYQPGLKSWSKLADSAERRKEELAKGHKPPLGIEKPAVLKPMTSQAPQTAGLREPVLQNLENLASLTAKQLKTYSASQFISKTKALMDDFGYHSVMFNLEKSPLYQAYLETGTRLLKDNVAFETLADESNSGRLGEKRFLTKDEFEDFTDLLMEIQAS